MAEKEKGKVKSLATAPPRAIQSMPLSKPMQALLLVLSLEEDAVARVLRHLDADDIRVIHELSKTEFKTDATSIGTAYRNFLYDIKEPLLAPGEGKAYIERLAQRSLGREESRNLFSGRESPKPYSEIEERSPQSVASVLRDENPQVIAAILAELSPSFSANVIGMFDRDQQIQVMSRLANLGEISSSTIQALFRAVVEQLKDLENEDAVEIDGMGRAASILQRLPIADTDEVLASMSDEDPAMVHKLRRAMFCFEDLINVQGRGMQMLIKEISNDQLLLALKTASDGLKDKILSAVSKRAAEILLDDLMAMGPVKLSEVEQAQQEIVDTALRLEAEGKIVIAGRGGEELV
jgi:flagellar motor switch protein FliG